MKDEKLLIFLALTELKDPTFGRDLEKPIYRETLPKMAGGGGSLDSLLV